MLLVEFSDKFECGYFHILNSLNETFYKTTRSHHMIPAEIGVRFLGGFAYPMVSALAVCGTSFASSDVLPQEDKTARVLGH